MGRVGEVPTPVEPLQTGQQRPGEQQRVPGGDVQEPADVAAFRQVTEELQGQTSYGRGNGGVGGRPGQECAVPVAGRGGEREDRDRNRSGGGQVRGEAGCGQRVRRRPGLGQLRQGGGRRRPVRVLVEQSGDVGPGEAGSQQAGVQALPDPSDGLGPEDGVTGFQQLGDEPVGAMGVPRVDAPHGLVEQLAGLLVPQHRGVREEFGAEPGDPHPLRQPGRTPGGQPPAWEMDSQPLVEPGQQERLVR